MVVQYTSHTLPLLAGIAIAALGGVVAWRRRRGDLEVWGTLVQGAVLLWLLTAFFTVSFESTSLKLVFLNALLPSAMIAATTFLVFTIHFVGRSEWLNRQRLAAIYALPAVGVVVTATNSVHKSVIENPELTTDGSVTGIDYSFGVGFYALFFVTYAYIFGYLGLLLHKALRSRNVYRKMSLVLFVSLFLLSAAPLVSVLGYSPFPHLLLFPYVYTALGGVLILSTSSSRFLRLLPIEELLARVSPQSQRTMATARDVVVQEIDNGILILDTEGVVVDINSTARKMIGADRPVGKHVTEAVPYERIESESVIRETLEAGEELQELTDELWVQAKDEKRCYEIRVTALTDSRGRDAGNVVLLHDITGRKRREETLREREAELQQQKEDLETQKAQLEHQNERLDQFASIVSHDLRNPLNVARGRLQIVSEGLASDEDPSADPEHASKVSDALERMEAIIDDALTLARQGKAITETEPVSLAATVERAWSNVETKGATLEVDVDVELESDGNRLLNVFENLFRNAIEHGSEDAVIRVGLFEDGFYVEDDGPGIGDADKEQIFEQGYTTSSDGTGFGLAIVQDVVRAHGWDVIVTDGSEGGARFEITGVDFDRSVDGSPE